MALRIEVSIILVQILLRSGQIPGGAVGSKMETLEIRAERMWKWLDGVVTPV